MTEKDTKYLNKVTLDKSSIRLKSALVRQEQAQALDDLRADTYFHPYQDAHGPYDIRIALINNTLEIQIKNARGEDLPEIRLSLKPYKRLIRDYFLIVESYEKARNESNTSRLEAIDMGRRGLHNEGAEYLKSKLSENIEMNINTARRLFTLLCILSAGRNALWF